MATDLFIDLLYPCHTEKDYKLYREGKLGVATSVDVLMYNLRRMTENPKGHLLNQDLETALNNPSLAGHYYSMCYLPDSGKEILKVTLRGKGTKEQMEERAQRNLFYKILRKKATHGVDYQVERNDDSITLRAIPMIFTQ